MHEKENVWTENVTETPDRCTVQTISVGAEQGTHGKRQPLTNIPLQRRTHLDAETQPEPAPERRNESNSDGKVDLSPDRGTQTGPLEEGLDRATVPGIALTDEIQDWRTQVRESMNELEQPELIPKIIGMMKNIQRCGTATSEK